MVLIQLAQNLVYVENLIMKALEEGPGLKLMGSPGKPEKEFARLLEQRHVVLTDIAAALGYKLVRFNENT